MLASIKLSGLGAAEESAKKILEHIEAIKELQREARFNGIDIEVDIMTEAASGN